MSAKPSRQTSLVRTTGQATKCTVCFSGRFLFRALFSGPKRLLTARISTKCAALITAMCAPSLICCAILMLPEYLFQHPHQNVYFQFAQVLEHDPGRWFAFTLSGLCAFASLAMPASLPAPPRPTLYS